MKSLTTILTILVFSSSVALAQTNHTKAQPPDGMSQVDAYSIFYSDFSNNDYKGALRYGKWILKGMPKTIKGYDQFDLATNLDRLITIYTSLGDNATDPALKTAYIDTANSIYDKVFANFSKDDIDYYQWHINRGRLYQQHIDFMDSAKAKATTEYQKAFDLDPQKMAQDNDGYYVQVLLQNLVARDTKKSKKRALAIIKKVGDSAGDSLNSYFDKVRNKLYSSPKERIAYLKKKVQKNPKDEDSIRELRNLYQQQGMTNKTEDLNKRLYKLDPSYQTTTTLANTAIQNGNYKDAITYLNEAKDKTDDKNKLETIYESLAQAYLNQNQLRPARTNAKKALHADTKAGQPYIILASIYARSVNQCTSGRDLDRNDRAVYWLVIDYLNKAKRVDSSLSGQVNSQISTYRKAAPTNDDIFFKDNWKKGKSIRINGSLHKCYSWINESTTVR